MKSEKIFLVLLAAVMPLYSQDAGSIVKSCIAALGGESGISRFSDFEAEGTIQVSMMGREFSGKLKWIRKMRQSWQRAEFSFGKDIYITAGAYNGRSAYSESMGNVVDVPALNYESDLRHGMDRLLDPAASYSLVRETEIEGRPAYLMEASSTDRKTVFCIDKENLRVLEIVFEDDYFGENDTRERLEKRIRYSDYQEMAGGPFPMLITEYEKGEEKRRCRLVEIRFNPVIDGKMFNKPDQKLDLRYWEEKMD
jgi:hypothetical protein